MSKSNLEEYFAYHIRIMGLPEPRREFKFAQETLGRLWRVDFAWPDQMLLVEIEGGTWIRGRHTRALGYEMDCRKYNAAAELGYIVLRYTRQMIESGEAVNQVERMLRKYESN